MSFKKDIISKALLNTNPGIEYRFYKGDIDTLEWLDKTKNHTSIDIVKEEIKRLQVEYDAKQYQRDRNYPDIGEQLDMLWHAIDNGEILGDKSCDFFKTLKKVKDDNPKPE